MKISKRAEDTQESPIRKLATIASKTKERGINVYHLNIGQPDISTPEVFFKHINEYRQKVLSYGPSDGLEELKKVMINYFSRHDIQLNKENIIICTGGSEAVFFAFNVIADPGDEIIIPEPFYTNYNGFASLAGVKIIPITTLAETGYHLPAIEEIEDKITPKTRAIMICSPNNPTGTILTEQEIQQLGSLAQKHNIFLIADEVYKEFTYDGEKHFSLLQLKGLEDKIIVVDSISKRYSACGARIGSVISRNKEVLRNIMKFAQARLCPPTLDQIGAIGAYQLPQKFFKSIIDEYQKRRDILFNILTNHHGVTLQKPKGAFYFMAGLPVNDSDEFAKWMLGEFDVNGETVMVAPGAGFYSTPGKGKQEIRIAYVLEAQKLTKAGEILIKAINKFNSI